MWVELKKKKRTHTQLVVSWCLSQLVTWSYLWQSNCHLSPPPPHSALIFLPSYLVALDNNNLFFNWWLNLFKFPNSSYFYLIRVSLIKETPLPQWFTSWYLSANSENISHIIGLKTCNFIKKRIQTQVFCCEYCEIFKNTYFEKHLRTIAFASFRFSKLKK